MRIVFLIPLLFIIAVNASGQETVYRTVNEQGVVSFSDTPPAGDEAVEKVQIDVATPQAPDEYLERLEAMRETTDRMASDRREREKHRAELRQIDVHTRAYEAPQVPELIESNNDYPAYGGYPYRPGRPPWRPDYRPGPEHPIARPPLRPQPRPADNNAQLMRPIVSPR